MTNYDLEKYLNEYLNTERIRDIASNGLQVEGKREIKKIALGVSISMPFLEEAVKQGADSILVHHGFFWGYPLLIKSYTKKRIKFILDNDLNVFAYHLPLDLHDKVGNNISIINLLKENFKITEIEPFGNYKGKDIGYKAKITSINAQDIKNTLTKTLGQETYFLDSNPSKKVETIAVVSGGAGDLLEEAILDNIDLFITGEIEEYTQAMCKETDTKYLALGHYNSEKLGVQKLGNLLKEKLDIEANFIDIPNKA